MYMNLHYQYQNSQQYRKGPVTWGDLSPLQNHLHDTKCDLTLRHVACDTPVLLNGTGNKLMIKMASQRRPWLVYLQNCRSDMSQVLSHEGTECAWDILSLQRVPWIQTDLNSCDTWLQHVTGSNCIKTYMSHKATCHGDVPQRQVASCDRTLSMRNSEFIVDLA